MIATGVSRMRQRVSTDQADVERGAKQSPKGIDP